jgi:hypothetical protein
MPTRPILQKILKRTFHIGEEEKWSKVLEVRKAKNSKGEPRNP